MARSQGGSQPTREQHPKKVQTGHVSSKSRGVYEQSYLGTSTSSRSNYPAHLRPSTTAHPAAYRTSSEGIYAHPQHYEPSHRASTGRHGGADPCRHADLTALVSLSNVFEGDHHRRADDKNNAYHAQPSLTTSHRQLKPLQPADSEASVEYVDAPRPVAQAHEHDHRTPGGDIKHETHNPSTHRRAFQDPERTLVNSTSRAPGNKNETSSSTSTFPNGTGVESISGKSTLGLDLGLDLTELGKMDRALSLKTESTKELTLCDLADPLIDEMTNHFQRDWQNTIGSEQVKYKQVAVAMGALLDGELMDAAQAIKTDTMKIPEIQAAVEKAILAEAEAGRAQIKELAAQQKQLLLQLKAIDERSARSQGHLQRNINAVREKTAGALKAVDETYEQAANSLEENARTMRDDKKLVEDFQHYFARKHTSRLTGGASKSKSSKRAAKA